jgi:hypothetical protein
MSTPLKPSLASRVEPAHDILRQAHQRPLDCIFAPRAATISEELRLIHPRILNISDDWAIYGLYMYLLASLLAASLIDIESYSIPAAIFWWAAGVGLVVHAIIDNPQVPGTLTVGPTAASLAGSNKPG